MPDIKRQTAYKCTISQLNNGKYVVQQGWNPNYIEVGSLKVSRVNILAVLLTIEGNVLTIDDGTGKIEIRMFSDTERTKGLNVGDIVLIIGRPREYQTKRYVVPEIIKKIEGKKWVQYRKKELALVSSDKIEVKEEKIESVPISEEPRPNYSHKIIETIKKLDSGEGAETEKVVKECDVKNAEEHIETLLNEGEIFEIRAGKLKVLE